MNIWSLTHALLHWIFGRTCPAEEGQILPPPRAPPPNSRTGDCSETDEVAVEALNEYMF